MSIKIRHVFFMLIFLGLLVGCKAPRLSQLLTHTTATFAPETPSIPVTIKPTTQPVKNTPSPFPTANPTPFPKNVFDNFQNLAGHCKVKTTFGKILSGETIEEPVLSETTIGKMWFSLFWDEGELDLTLLDPDGNVVDRTFPNGHKINENFTSKPELQQYFFRGPQEGQWTAKISAKSVPATGSDYKFEVGLDTALITSIWFDKDEYFSNDIIKLSTQLGDDFLPSGGPAIVLDAVIKVTAEDPAQNQYSFELYDDGTHGDPKAGDGKYTNSFDKTALPGIYKFSFQISGHNIRAGEPFTRECFLAKTVKTILPTVTPIPDGANKVCKGATEISELVVVRAENVGGNDSSEYSRYAFSPQGVSTNAGILVTWNMGFLGEAPQPNAYMRLLDDNAQPVNDLGLLFQRNWLTQKAYSFISRGNDVLITYSGRFDKNDKPVSALVNAEGQLISEELRLPDHFPVRETIEGVWTGTHFIFASTGHQFVGLNVVQDLVLETADTNGKSISSKILMKLDTPLHLSNSISIDSLVVGHERILMTISKYMNGQNHIFIYPFDLEGNQLDEPVVLDPPLIYERQGEILTGKFGRTYMVPTESGWMILIPSVGEGMYVAYLNPVGSLISSPKLIDDTLNLENGFGNAIPYHGGVAILKGDSNGGWIVLFVSAYGSVGQQWKITEADAREGSLINHKGRLFLLYTSGPKTTNPETNQVLIRELQCAP